MSEWRKWSQFVLAELERLNRDVEKLDDKITAIDKSTSNCQTAEGINLGNLKESVGTIKTRLSTLGKQIGEASAKWNELEGVTDSIETLKTELSGKVQSLEVLVSKVQGVNSVWIKIWLALISAGVIGLGVKFAMFFIEHQGSIPQ